MGDEALSGHAQDELIALGAGFAGCAAGFAVVEGVRTGDMGYRLTGDIGYSWRGILRLGIPHPQRNRD